MRNRKRRKNPALESCLKLLRDCKDDVETCLKGMCKCMNRKPSTPTAKTVGVNGKELLNDSTIHLT